MSPWKDWKMVLAIIVTVAGTVFFMSSCKTTSAVGADCPTCPSCPTPDPDALPEGPDAPVDQGRRIRVDGPASVTIFNYSAEMVGWCSDEAGGVKCFHTDCQPSGEGWLCR